MSKPFFPLKQYGTGSTPEEWEVEMRKQLEEDLDNGIHKIKERASTRFVEKSVYIEHLISEEKIKRLKSND